MRISKSLSGISNRARLAAMAGLVAAAGLGLAGAANAAIAVTNSVAGITTGLGTSDGAGSLFTSANFDMSGGNAVALLFTAENLVNNSATLSATFAGQAMTTLTASVTTTGGAQSATIFYLINPVTTSGVFQVTIDPGVTTDYAYSQIALSNVLGVADTDTISSTSNSNLTPLNVSYTTTTDGGYVLGAAANNDFNNARQLSISSGNPDTNLLSHTVIGSSGHFHTHGDVATAGPYTDGYLGQYQRTAIATVAFDAVPEPATLALMGLGGLLMLGRRRARA